MAARRLLLDHCAGSNSFPCQQPVEYDTGRLCYQHFVKHNYDFLCRETRKYDLYLNINIVGLCALMITFWSVPFCNESITDALGWLNFPFHVREVNILVRKLAFPPEIICVSHQFLRRPRNYCKLNHSGFLPHSLRFTIHHAIRRCVF
jgi:hypothetical protein